MSTLEQFGRRILPRQTYNALADFMPAAGSVYLSGKTTEEERAYDLHSYIQSHNVTTGLLVDADDKSFIFDFEGEEYIIGLTNGKEHKWIWEKLNAAIVYLDITSLSHRIWAILVKSARRADQHIKVLYIEPGEYSRENSEESEGTESYDLSESYLHFQGIPGFSSLDATYDDNVSYVPLLGFEGVRFKLATTDAVPPAYKTFPIVGLPGFRPEYPFAAYVSNRESLIVENDSIIPNVMFVDASCPFSLFYVLGDLANKNEEDILKIALIGTKPHALGAILFALSRLPGTVQLLYDYPRKKAGRTSGIGRVHVYHVSFFFSSIEALAT